MSGLIGGTPATQDAVTLSSAADVLLGLTGQQLTLDTQNANMVVAGPTTGAAAAPTARALVTADIPTAHTTRTINYIIGGGASEIADGVVKGDIVFDFACTIQSWTLLADVSGAIKVDVWVEDYANYPPTDADSITNGHEPEITASGAKAQDTDLADWTTVSIAAGDVMRFNIDSCTTITTATLSLKVLVS